MATEEDLRGAQMRLAERQFRWETWKAIAMIALAGAAIAAAGRLADWINPPRPQSITVHIVKDAG
jgi:hypothetical protein